MINMEAERTATGFSEGLRTGVAIMTGDFNVHHESMEKKRLLG